MYTRGRAVVARQRAARGVAEAVKDALDGDLGLVDRVGALWALEGVAAGDVVDGRGSSGPLACVIGALLSHPSPMLAREACELLCHLDLDAPFSSPEHAIVAAELAVAVGVTRGGALAVSPRSFQRCEPLEDFRAWCPDLDVEVVPLVDVHRLVPRLAAPLGLLDGCESGRASTLVVVAGPRLGRVRRQGRLGADAQAPFARAEAGAFTLVAPGSSFVVDGEAVAEARVRGHHRVAWGDVRAEVTVVPSLSDQHRVLVEVPDGGYDAVAVGDAWFSRLKHARGHIAVAPDRRALVVDRTASDPAVRLLSPGEGAPFGAYDVDYLEHGGVLRISAQRADGPDRSRPAIRQAASAGRRAA